MVPGQAIADVIDIEPLVRLHDRMNAGQIATQVVMLGILLVVLASFGARIAMASVVVHVVLSVYALRGHRGAAIALFIAVLAGGAIALTILGYEALVRNWPESPLGSAARRATVRAVYIGMAVVAVGGWYVIRAIAASLVRYRILPSPPLDPLASLRAWRGGLRRFVTRWQAWAFLALGSGAIALIEPDLILDLIAVILFDRAYWSGPPIDPPLVTLAADLPDWAGMLAMLVGFAVLVGVFLGAFLRLRRHIAESAAEAVRRDARPPVLFLRSFADDGTRLIWSHGGGAAIPLKLERTLEKTLRRYGPVLAIGRPGETLPPIGAAREYLTHETWRRRVAELIDESQLVVVVMGSTSGLVFEYEQIAQRRAIDKVLLIVPPHDRQELQRRWDQFVRHALGGSPLPPPDLQAAIVACFHRERRPQYIVHPKRRAAAEHYTLALQLALHRRSGAS